MVQRQIEIDLRRGGYCDSVRVKLEENNAQLRELLKLKDELIDEQDGISTIQEQQISDLLKIQTNDAGSIKVLTKEVKAYRRQNKILKIGAIVLTGVLGSKLIGVF